MNNLKRISTLLAVILVLSMALFAICSCGGDSTDSSTPVSTPGSNNTTESTPDSEQPPVDNGNLVTVTVVDENGNGIEGAVIQICQGEQCFGKPIQTGSNGTGSREYTLNGDRLKAKILEIEGMDDYLVPAELGYVYFATDSRTLTITVQNISLTVKDQSGKGVEGVKLQLAQGEHFFNTTLITDANGNANGYAAISGDNITVTILEILSGSYEYSKGIFDVIGYNCNLTVKKQVNYTVNVLDVTGMGISGAEVKLFDVANGYLQAKKTTDSNGAAKFENMQIGEYYVTVSHPNPAYVITTEATDGKYYFASGETTLNLEATELETLIYEITVSNGLAGQVVSIFDDKHNYITEAETDENGNVTFELKNGSYVAVLAAYDTPVVFTPAILNKNGQNFGTITVKDGAENGTEENPIYVICGSDVYVAAGETVYLAIPHAYRKSVSFSGLGSFDINYNGNVIASEDEYISISTVEKAGETAIIALSVQEDAYVYVSVSAPGSIENPFDLDAMYEDLNGVELSCTVGNYETLYYKLVAKEDGVLKITTATQYAYILINGEEITMYPMIEGEEILISISSMDWDNFESPVIDAELTFAVGNEEVDYTVTVYCDGELLPGCTVKIYMYDENGEIVVVATATADENGVAVFEDMSYLANYFVEVDLTQMEGYELVNETFNFGVYTEYEAHLSHVKDGSIDYPFEFDYFGAEEITLEANQTIYYIKYINYSMDGTTYKVVAYSDKVVLKAYYIDGNEEEQIVVSTVVDGNSVLTFPEEGVIYTIEVTCTEDVEFEMEVVEEAPEVGSDFYNSYEIESEGVYSDTIEGTKYFVFTGVSNSVKIVVSGEVQLFNVLASFDGVSLEIAEGNTIEIDTNGDWVYFAITSDSIADCEITITVE